MAGIGFIPILGDGAKAIVDTSGRAIRGLKGLGKSAGIAGGGERAIDAAGNGRKSASAVLDEVQISQIKREFEEIGGDTSMLSFNTGSRTSYVDKANVINVRGDVFPNPNGVSANSRMSSRAVLAHEFHGHAANRFTTMQPGSFRDEFRASYRAAIRGTGLSDLDRYNLMTDALERARDAGVHIRYNKKIRSIIYGG